MANLLKWLKDRKEEVVAQVNPFDQGRTAHTVRQNITPTPPPQRQQPAPPPQSQFRFPTAPPVSSIPKPTSHFKFADNSITRGLSRAYDQINPVDAGRSWQQTEASNIAAKRSGGAQLRALTGQQTPEDINALYADTEKLQRQSIQDFNAGKIDKTQHIKNMQTAANQSSAVQKTTDSSIDTSLPNLASRKIFGQDYTGKEEGGISSKVGRITRPALNIGKFNAITALDDSGDYLQTLAKGSRFEDEAANANDILDLPGKAANLVTGNGWKAGYNPYEQPGNIAEVNKEEDGWLATQIAKYTEMTGQTANFANPYTAYAAMAGTISKTGQENYDDLIAQGFSEQDAKLRATASGATQALIERWSSKFQAGVGTMFGKNAAKQVVTKTLPKKAVGLLLMTQKEGGTEAAEEVLQTITNNVATNKPWNQGVVNAAVEGYKGGVMLSGVFAGGAAIESRTTNPDQAQQQNTAIQEQVGMLEQQKATNPQAAMQIDQQIGQLNQTRAQNNLAIATSLVPEGTALQKITQGIKKATTLNESGAIAGVGAYGYTDASKAGRVFEGVDGKPRFEIDDSTAKMKITDKDLKEWDGSVLDDLGNVLDHPTLFKNYPQLAKTATTVTIDPNKKEGSLNGSFDGEEIYVTAPNLKKAKEVLMHEIQHNIQQEEGFATGGNPDGFANDQELKADNEMFKTELNYINKQLETAKDLGYNDSTLMEGKTVAELKAEKKRFEASLKETKAGLDNYKTPYENYKSLAGEAEARAVQNRVDMKDSERYKAPEGKKLYHGTDQEFDQFEVGRPVKRRMMFGEYDTTSNGIFFTDSKAETKNFGRNTKEAVVDIKKPLVFSDKANDSLFSEFDQMIANDKSLADDMKPFEPGFSEWMYFDGKLGKKFIEFAKSKGFDGALLDETGELTGEDFNTYVAFDSKQVKTKPQSTFYDSLDVSKDDLIVRNNNDTANSIFDSPAVRELKSTRKRLQTQYDNATSKTTKNQIAKAIKNIELEIRKEQSTSMSITGDADADAAIERDSVRNYLRSKPAVKGDATTGEGAQLPGKGMTQEQKQSLIDKARAKVDPLDSLKQEARKYKSAEEFVKAKTNAYHGSPFSIANRYGVKKFDLSKSGISTEARDAKLGAFVTPDEDFAARFAYQVEEDMFGNRKVYDGGTITPTSVLSDKILDLGNVDQKTAKSLVDSNLVINKTPQEIIKMSKTIGGQKQLQENIAGVYGGDLSILQRREALKQLGYDVIRNKVKHEGRGNVEMVVLNEDAIMTKSQLTDLYNQATLKDNQSGSVQIPSFIANLADRIKNSKLTQNQVGSIQISEGPISEVEAQLTKLNPNLDITSLTDQQKRIALANVEQQANRVNKDTGKKMYGSKKDLAKLSRITTENIQEIENEGERVAAKLVTKKRVLGNDATYSVDRTGDPGVENYKKLAVSAIPSTPAQNADARAFFVKETPGYIKAVKAATTIEEIQKAANDYINGASKERQFTSWTGETKTVTDNFANKYLGARAYNMLRGYSGAMRTAKYRPPTDFSFDEKKATTRPVDTGTAKPKIHGGEQVAYERRGAPSLKNKDPQSMVKDFGFKGLEYGNYVKNSESAVHMTKFGDSMLDLETVLGLDMSTLNKEANLGVGFGSRGGGMALAHYEPSNKVINITKKNTVDGSLAHEYMHAIDDFLGGEKLGRSNYASSGAAVKPAVQSAAKELMSAIEKGDGSYKQTIELGDNYRNPYRSWAAIDQRLAGNDNNAEAAITQLVKDFPSIDSKRIESAAKYAMDKAGAKSIQVPTGKSEFYTLAKEQGDYWARPTELMARAFDGYIGNKLDAAGIKNNYVAKGERAPGLYHPNEAHAKQLEPLFDNLFKAIKQEYNIPSPSQRATTEVKAAPQTTKTTPASKTIQKSPIEAEPAPDVPFGGKKKLNIKDLKDGETVKIGKETYTLKQDTDIFGELTEILYPPKAYDDYYNLIRKDGKLYAESIYEAPQATPAIPAIKQEVKTPKVADNQTIPTVDQLNAKLAKEGKKEFKAKGKIVSVKDSGKDGIDVTFENGETIKNASIPADLAPGRKIAGTETTVKQYQDAQDKLSAAMFRLLDSKDGSRKYNNNTGSSLMWSTGFTSNLVAPEAIAYSKQNNVPLEEGILESIKKAGHLKKDGYGTDPYIDLKNELTKTKPTIPKTEVKTPSIKSIQKDIDSLKLAQQNSDTVAGAKSYQKDIDELEASLPTKKQIPTTKKVATPKARGKTDLKFIETVKDSKNTSPELKTELKTITAGTKSNVSTIRQAARRINKRGLDQSVEQSHNPNVHTLEQQSERLILIEELQKQNRNGDAVTVVEEFARSARKLGQATQIAAAYNKLTPAGILKLAQREIDKAKKVNPRKYKDLKLDPAKAKELTDKVTKVQKMKEGPEKVKATRDMLDDVDAIVPTPTARKITTLWKAGLLTGVKGGIAGNTVGNTSYQIMRKVADVPAAGLDAALGVFTGTRSKTFTLAGIIPGFGTGLKVGAERMKTGTGADDLSTKYDYKKTKYGDGMLGKAAQAYTDTVFNFYSAADKPFFHAALQNSLQDLVRTEATNRKLTGEAKKNFIKRNMLEPSDDINTQAVAEAEKAVFQNKNALGAALSGFKQNLARKGGAPGEIASEIIAPFTGVPSAIATAAYDFSLINTVVETAKAIKESSKGTFDQKSQRALTESFGKGLTGTALLGLGYQLVGSGLMTLGYPDDPDERALWDLEKKTPYSIKVGGKWRSLNYTGPVMAIMAIGGETQKIQEAEGGNKLQSLKGGVFGSGKAILSSSPLQGAQGALNAITDPQRYGDSYVNNLAGSVIPTIVKDVSRTTDTKDGKVVEREVNNPWQSIQNRTPWRDKLDPKRDKFGQDITSTSPIGAVIDPFKSSDAQTSPMQRELRRLFEAKEGTSPPKVDAKVTIGGTENRSEITLTDKQLNAYKKQVGDATMTAWDAMMKTDKYKALSDSDKRKALENVAEDINAVEMRKFQADNQIGEYAPGFTGEQKDLEKRQKQMLKDGFNADKYTKASRTGGGTVDIPDGLSKDYTSILEKHADMTDEERDKVAYSQNDYDYNYKVARYESDKLAGKLSKAEDVNRKQELVKEQVGKDFTKETREVYNSLSKDEIDGLDDETYRKAVDYGDALVDAGIIKKNKLRTYARGSGRSGSSKKAKKISIDMLKKASVVPNVNINTKSRKMRVAIPKAPSFKYRTPRVATTKLSKAQLPTSRRVNIS